MIQPTVLKKLLLLIFLMMPELINKQALQSFLKEKNLELVEKIAKGFSGEVYLVKDKQGKKFALKIERKDSPRENMVEKEVANLQKANSVGLGPKLTAWDFQRRIILYEFIDGVLFNKWINSIPQKEDLKKVLSELFAQAVKLDEIGLDHGQLAGKGTNIIVSTALKPVIVDFEKASQHRKCHNVTQLTSFIVLNPKSALARKIKGILKN